jgi:predicted unusual protein kinase regulating ubiquinone biosynthesis (AarF/ABC1/UbiB family)
VSSARESLARLDALFGVGLRIARSARSGRIALAQLAAALDPQWLPSPEADDLVSLLTNAETQTREPIGARDVERMLRDAWGARPREELDAFEPEPVAVTPGAQVHRGTLDGAPVAIKVLRPGLAASVRQDLALLEALAAPLRAAFPALDAPAMLREVRERVLEELDLESEATVQRRFSRALRRHPFLSVPAPISRLCHEGVLVSEWVDGVPLLQAAEPDQAAARLLVFVLGAARWGISYADPHHDNVLVTPDGGLAIVDFGACRPIDGARLEAAIGVLASVVDEDAQALGGHLEALGWMAASHARETLSLARALAGPLLAPGVSRFDAAEVIAARERLALHSGALDDLLPCGALAPEDLWPGRGVAALLGTVARLGATGDWVGLALGALREGWDAPAP